MRVVLIVITIFLAVAGCSREQLKRTGYDMVKQQSCLEGTRNIPNEEAFHLECVTSAGKEGMSYEDYQKARSNSSGDNAPGLQNPR